MRNLNLLFHKLYYREIKNTAGNPNNKTTKRRFEEAVKAQNTEIFNSCFVNAVDFLACEIPNVKTIRMKTKYPGLLIGTGYPHGSGRADDDIKCGFSFDYVSGQPYIPGSSVKGVLRSHFKDHPDAVAEIANITKENVKDLETNIFDHGDVFLDAVLYDGNDKNLILGAEYITPHSDSTKNPIPIHIIKVLPDVRFEFRFVVCKFENSEFTFAENQKIELFEKLLKLFGIGAKTNVGFGILERDDSAPRDRVLQQQSVPQTSGEYGNNSRSSNGYSSNNRGYSNNATSGNGAVSGSEKVKCPHCKQMNYKYNKQGGRHTRCFKCGKDLPK